VNPSEVFRLLLALREDLHDIDVLWQIAIIVAALITAWWVSRLIDPRLARADGELEITLGGLQRLLFPLTGLVMVLVGRAALRQWHGVSLLDVAVPLLTALAIVRVTVYALRRAFSSGGWLRSSERLIAWVVWLGFAVYITGLAPGVIAFFDGIAFHIGNTRVSLLLILQAALVISVTLLTALWLGSMAESRLMGMGAQTLDLNLRVVLAKFTRALLAIVALLIALPAVGLDLTLLSVFGGALGVGLGFGLQKIASNYVSGFIILMDRSVSLGDMISVDRSSGQISKMTARYVVLRGLDGTETLVPNETLVTSPVVNNSYSDPSICVTLTVSIDYSADPESALRIIEAAAQRQSRVMRKPPAAAVIRQLGERGIELELGFWVEDPQLGIGPLRSELLRDILRGFRENGIAFPPPTRDGKSAPAPASSSP
jgi:small-conductance mechanosensitive channel